MDVPQRLFVSHSFRDKKELDGLRRAIPRGTQLVVFPELPADPEEPVSGAIVREIRSCSGLVYLDLGHSRASRWVAFEKDYAARAGLPVFSFDGRLSLAAVKPSPLEIVVTVSDEARGRARDLLDWMEHERDFQVWDLRVATRVKEIPIHYLEVLESRNVALWLLDSMVAGMINVLAHQLTCSDLLDFHDGHRLPPAAPYLLARIDPKWRPLEGQTAEEQAVVDQLYPTQRFVDLVRAGDAEGDVDWNRADDLIVSLTAMSLRWHRWLEDNPKWRTDWEPEAEDEADGSDDADDDSVDDEGRGDWEWAYPYFCAE